jgi:hypothetical protein
MNVTFYAPYAAWPMHFETDLELMQLHLDQGDEVTAITCDAAFTYCEADERHDLSTCAKCVGRAREGFKRLSRPVKVLKLSELILQARRSRRDLARLPRTHDSFESLYQFKVDQFDIGAAVLSSLNSVLDEREPDPKAHPVFTRESLASAYAAYAAFDHYLEQNPCDLVYFLNGRLANFRAALRACQKHQVRFLVHERGATLDSYSLAENTMPHDPVFITKNFADTLKKADSAEQKQAVAREFYLERRAGKVANWVSFTDYQHQGSLPEGWLEAPIRIAVFSSTESEFSCLREYYPTPIYPSQFEGLQKILAELARDNFAGIFTVRMHPNSVRTECDFTDQLRSLPYPFLRVIAPEETGDSYALLQSAQKVLTWGSTIGIEAAYWGKPSILAAWAEYGDLGSTYNPTSHAELMDLLRRPLDPKPIDGAIDYGFYSMRFGTTFKYVKPEGPFWALFKGDAIVPKNANEAFLSENPTRFEKWQRAFWATWNKRRLKAIYRGRSFAPDPVRWIVRPEEETVEQKNGK